VEHGIDTALYAGTVFVGTVFGAVVFLLRMQQKQVRKALKSRRFMRRKLRQNKKKADEEIEKLRQEILLMQRQCPVLSGEATCSFEQCPLHEHRPPEHGVAHVDKPRIAAEE
jgi:hypothetical protein